jgi:hypothetical protein
MDASLPMMPQNAIDDVTPRCHAVPFFHDAIHDCTALIDPKQLQD